MHDACKGTCKFPCAFPGTFMHHTCKGTCKFPCTFPMYIHAPHMLRYIKCSTYPSHVNSYTTHLKVHGNFHAPFPCTFMHHTFKGTWKFPCTFPMFIHAPHRLRYLEISMHLHAHSRKGALWKFPCIFVCNTIKPHRNFHVRSDDTESVHGNFYSVL